MQENVVESCHFLSKGKDYEIKVFQNIDGGYTAKAFLDNKSVAVSPLSIEKMNTMIIRGDLKTKNDGFAKLITMIKAEIETDNGQNARASSVDGVL
jgi:hypothetical protein